MIQERHVGAFAKSFGLSDKRLANLLHEQAQDPICKETRKLAVTVNSKTRIVPHSGVRGQHGRVYA